MKKIYASFILATAFMLIMSLGVLAATCPSGTTSTPVETVTVPSNGTSVTSTNILESGVTYLLEANGTYRFANWGDYGIADAEYAYRNDAYAKPILPDNWTLGEDNYPSGFGLDVQVDNTNIYWGEYSTTHVYTYAYAGTGNQVQFHIYDSAYGDNSGSLTVDINKCVDTTPPVITFEQPLNGSTHSGVINLRAECNEDCDYINFWWRAENEVFAWYRYHYVHDDGTVFEWGLNTLDAQLANDTSYLMEDGTYYLYAAGKDLAGNWARTPEIMVIVENDLDNDGILNGEDRCPGTNVDELEKELGTNRWKWNGTAWETKLPNGIGPQKSFTMEDTRGCSCSQILDKMGGKMMGHRKFGCSISVMEDFIAGLPPIFVDTVEVYANDPTPTYSNIDLESGTQYELEAVGTAFAGDTIDFDAKYSLTNRILGDTWTDTVSGYTSYGTTLLDLFVNGGSVDWGAYNDEHTYYWTLTGNGAPLELWIYDTYPSNNVGFITVNIYERQ